MPVPDVFPEEEDKTMRLGVSWSGVVIFALPMFINIAYALFPPANAPEETPKEKPLSEWVEQGSRMLYMLAICFLVSRQPVRYGGFWFCAGILFLLLYHIVWLRYFAGGRYTALLGKPFGPVPMPLVVFPVLYFLCAAIWLHNLPAVVCMIVFGAAHAVVSYRSLSRE